MKHKQPQSQSQSQSQKGVLEGESGVEEELVELNNPIHPTKKYNIYAVLTKPHSLTAMILLGITLAWLALTRPTAATMLSNVKLGLLGVILSFLLFALTNFPDGLFHRPHPLFWRLVMGLGVLYVMLLVFLMFQSVDDARWLVSLLDPKLGTPLPERSYAVDCRFYTPDDPISKFRNMMDAIKDEFFIAHAVGWWVKTLMLRDVKLTLFLSVLFEILELSLQHILPNFAECWWDHIILDLIFTNGLGIWVGYYSLRYLEMKQYNWTGITKIKSSHGKIIRVLGQFTPESWTQFNWGIFSSWKRFLYFIFLVFMTEMVELGVFTLKALLWIPPPHPIVLCRLALMGLVVAPGLREYYQFMIDPNVHVFGPNAWICCAITSLELLLTFKWSNGIKFSPAPFVVKWGWIITVIVITVFFFTYFPYREHIRKNASKNTPKVERKAAQVSQPANLSSLKKTTKRYPKKDN